MAEKTGKENMADKKRKKPGLWYRFAVKLVRPFKKKMTCTYHAGPLPEGPVVFVANHAQIFGPLSAVLEMPRKVWPWVDARIMEKKTAAEFAFIDFLQGDRRRCKWFFRMLSHIVSFLLRPLLRDAGGIPVYRDRQIVRTFARSCELLNEGESLILFPEKEYYFSDYIFEIQDGFVDLARIWYRQSGRLLKFIPLYFAPGLNTVNFGEPVVYDPQADPRAERRRVAGLLKTRIHEMASSLPPHKPIPFYEHERMLQMQALHRADGTAAAAPDPAPEQAVPSREAAAPEGKPSDQGEAGR